jgi:hypothetical protein
MLLQRKIGECLEGVSDALKKSRVYSICSIVGSVLTVALLVATVGLSVIGIVAALSALLIGAGHAFSWLHEDPKALRNAKKLQLEFSLCEQPNDRQIRDALVQKLQRGGYRKLGIGVEAGVISIEDLMCVATDRVERISLCLGEYLSTLPNPIGPNEDKLNFYRRQFAFIRTSPRDMNNLKMFVRSAHALDSPFCDRRFSGHERGAFCRQEFSELFFRTLVR